jgi:hypothetical protein
MVSLYENSPYSPIAAGYATISGDTVTAVLKSIPDSLINEMQENPPNSLAEAGNLIKDLPDAWTGSGSYYMMLWADAGRGVSKTPKSFTNANTTVPFSPDAFDFDD